MRDAKIRLQPDKDVGGGHHTLPLESVGEVQMATWMVGSWHCRSLHRARSSR